ncbi:unnamed protein product [Rhodiola kirilowii]
MEDDDAIPLPAHQEKSLEEQGAYCFVQREIFERKLEKELVYSRGGPSNDPEENEPVVDEDVEDDQPKESISGTTTYDNGDIQVTVTTSEISRKEEVHLPSQKQQPEPAAPVEESTKKLKTAVKMKPTKKTI